MPFAGTGVLPVRGVAEDGNPPSHPSDLSDAITPMDFCHKNVHRTLNKLRIRSVKRRDYNECV